MPSQPQSQPLTFDRCGDGYETFTSPEGTHVFVRVAFGAFWICTVNSGEPVSGNEYDTFRTAADASEFLSRRGFTLTSV
jgi:hypothetical protein